MLRLNVVTPERAFLDEECMSVTLPGKLGEMQVLTGHAACLVELAAGQVTYENQHHESKSFTILPGFAEVANDRVNILCDRAEDPIAKT